MSSKKIRPAQNSAFPEPRTGGLLRLAWQRVREHIYNGVQSDGYGDLNPAHVALFRFEGLDGKRPTQLSEQMQITKQSIHDLLRHLEQCGYIEIRPDPSDKRARHICLTARGRRLEASVLKYARAAEREFERQLGPERFRTFRSALQIITGHASRQG